MAEIAHRTCLQCGEEVRWGWRHEQEAWWHREDVDHAAVFVTRSSPELLAHLNELNAAKAARAAAKAKKDEDDEPIPELSAEIEQRATPVDPSDLPARSGMRQMCNLVEKTDGWELVSLTAARGPYMGSRGEVLSISDSLLLRARGPEVDGVRRMAVASWRDTKFDFAYVFEVKAARARFVRSVNSTDLKSWIKGGDLPPAEGATS